MGYRFTSESVSEGHPDKVADQISDAILDAYLAKDSSSRVAIETLVTSNRVILAGETHAEDGVEETINRVRLARETIRDIGYTDPALNFAADTVQVCDLVHGQSKDIRGGVDPAKDKELGAGDQGMMFGFACREIENDIHRGGQVLMPMPLYYAHRLMEELARIRKEGQNMQYLKPDSKSQVTVEYDEDDRTPRSIPTVVLSTCHQKGVRRETIKADIQKHVLPEVFGDQSAFMPAELIVNPAGPFVLGGPHADTGLTGRKIIVDTYGGRGAHGGGAFSGKDPSKVDRSAAYAVRHVAKNMVAAGLADMVEVQVSYAIGRAKPVSVYVDTSGTAKDGRSDQDLCKLVERTFDLRPAAIIERLQLVGDHRPTYRNTAAYGHFGRSEFSWEKLCAVKDLQQKTSG